MLMARAHRYAIDYIEQAPGNRKLGTSGKVVRVLLADCTEV
jgi:hypothetical protein